MGQSNGVEGVRKDGGTKREKVISLSVFVCCDSFDILFFFSHYRTWLGCECLVPVFLILIFHLFIFRSIKQTFHLTLPLPTSLPTPSTMSFPHPVFLMFLPIHRFVFSYTRLIFSEFDCLGIPLGREISECNYKTVHIDRTYTRPIRIPGNVLLNK